MKSVGDIVRIDPVWVNPAHIVGSAIMLMRGHHLHGLPVMDGGSLVGMLYYDNLVNVNMHRRVDEVMVTQSASLADSLPLRQAADIMVRENLICLPVTGKEGELLGQVTSLELLSELRRSLDPLTELPWSDTLREWGIATLSSGKEITILFIDINDFGLFNKRFGHVVGDTALRAVAEGIRRLMQPELDLLCRYGGDEFCIATLRNAQEAEALAEAVKRIVHVIALPEMPNETIQVSIGQRGGRRTQEREHIHYAATLNNLINLASRDCAARKAELVSAQANAAEGVIQSMNRPESQEEVMPTQDHHDFENTIPSNRVEIPNEEGSVASERLATEPLFSMGDMLYLNHLEITWDQAVAHVAVEIECRSSEAGQEESRSFGIGTGTVRRATGSQSATMQTIGSLVSKEIDQNALPMLIAEATLAALQRILPDNTTVCLEDVVLAQTTSGRDAVTILSHVATPSGNRSLTGTALVGEDAPRAVASAVLTACNSLLDEVSSASTAPAP